MKGPSKPVNKDIVAEHEQVLLALQSAGVGTWSFDPILQKLNCDSCCQALYGFSGDKLISFDDLQPFIHPDDRKRFQQLVQQVLAGQSDGLFTIRIRIVTPAGAPTRWIENKGKAYYGQTNALEKFTGIVQEVTEKAESGQAHQEIDGQEQELQRLFEQAPVILSIMGRNPDFVYQMANTAYAEFVDRPLQDIIGKPMLEVLPEIRGQGFDRVLEQVMMSGLPYVAREAPVQLKRKGKTDSLYLDFIYQPIYKTEEEVSGVMGLVIDVTNSVLSRQKVEQSEARFRQVIEQTPVAMLLVKGPDFVFDTINQPMLTLLNRGPEIIGKPALEAIPELMGQPIMDLLQSVYQTGEPYQGWAVEIPLVRQGKLEARYFNLSYSPYYEGNQLTGIIQVATEVTEQVKSRKIVEASEARFRTLVQAAPVAIGLFVGRDLIIESPNQAFIDIVGKGDTITGKPLKEAMPELVGQPFLQILDDVYTTGQPFHTFDTQVNVLHNGILTSGYYDFSYTPVLNGDGQVYAILEIAIDVTERVVSRQKVAEAEEGLRGAIELAELGTWSIDPIAGTVYYSDRLRSWYGYEEGSLTIDRLVDAIHEKDRKRVREAIASAMTPASGGIYDAEFMIEDARTGRQRIVHAQAKTFFTDDGKAYKMVGTARDVTEQRKVQVRLEQQVQQRTQELLLANQDLMRSNDNLQQFAYIASHDLQEPLRKIQSFGDILKDQYAIQLGDGTHYLERMQSAATRMSGLIRDLLAFSRISIQQDATEPVLLVDVVYAVLTDLELIIQETGAQITIGDLPIVQGDSSQLGQLFQNLLSNALKFRKPNIPPIIHVSAGQVSAADLPPSTKPVRITEAYHCIEVADNGIGFNEKYIDRIFQVFQRLHSKNEFTGTGIGLAICEKVVANHGGSITARSTPGQGATFTIYLPF